MEIFEKYDSIVVVCSTSGTDIDVLRFKEDIEIEEE
jgi:hypothetical protein